MSTSSRRARLGQPVSEPHGSRGPSGSSWEPGSGSVKKPGSALSSRLLLAVLREGAPAPLPSRDPGSRQDTSAWLPGRGTAESRCRRGPPLSCLAWKPLAPKCHDGWANPLLLTLLETREDLLEHDRERCPTALNLTDVLLLSHPDALVGPFREKAQTPSSKRHTPRSNMPYVHTRHLAFPTPMTLTTTSRENVGSETDSGTLVAHSKGSPLTSPH